MATVPRLSIAGATLAIVATTTLGGIYWGWRGAGVTGLALVAVTGAALLGYDAFGSRATPRTGGSGSSSLMQDLLAGFIVFASLGTIIYLAIWVSVPAAQAFAAVVAGVLGGVIGYYFGAKSTSDVRDAMTGATQAAVAESAASSVKLAASAQAREAQVRPALVDAEQRLKKASSAFSFRGKVLQATESDAELKAKLEALLEPGDLEV